MWPKMTSLNDQQVLGSYSGNGWRILVVEDEAIIAMDIQDILKKLGYSSSEVVHSGEESIEKVAAGHPHLVLMDIKLKGKLDGIQAAHQIFEKYNVPVVYITAYADENTLKRVDGTGRFGYITKPFEETELQTTIQGVLQKAYI
jgi:CheY-like chemotaxis protein